MSLVKYGSVGSFGVNYVAGSLYDLVHRIGYSLQSPKEQCRNADPEKQAALKRNSRNWLRVQMIIL
ncbi:MAG: helix-turn-helix domain-containing protein [Caulobacteraceae bacterium]